MISSINNTNNEGLIEQYNAYTPVKLLHVKDVRNSVGSSLTNTATSGIGGALAGAGVGALAGSSGGPYGAIIGAGSVVTKDVLPNTIVAGNPARQISTVAEYIKKCEERGVLFDTPSSFEKYYENSLGQKEIIEFQEKYINSKFKKKSDIQ